MEIGSVSTYLDTYEGGIPTDDSWFDALLADDIHRNPIVVFSYNKAQTRKSDAESYNIYRFGEWLKEQGETFTVSPWTRNGSSRIQLATWIPSKKFKSKVERVSARFKKQGI